MSAEEFEKQLTVYSEFGPSANVSDLEVVDSERTALTAERDSARISGQRLVTSVQLIKALGGGWTDPSVPKFASNQK